MPIAQRPAPEPRWPAMLALLAVAGLHFSLPSALTIGPDWLLLAIVAVLLVPTIIAHRAGKHAWNAICGHIVSSVVTADVIASLGLLISRLPAHSETPLTLLHAAVGLWICNLLVFAVWYWRLDAGGPNQRDLQGSHTDGAFLFPQMVMDPALKVAAGEQDWRPGFVDYLFLAFNTSTAFSPTDVPVLSRWAKGMMMVQASISFTTVVILAARAVNIL
jgi:hypothetical protein